MARVSSIPTRKFSRQIIIKCQHHSYNSQISQIPVSHGQFHRIPCVVIVIPISKQIPVWSQKSWSITQVHHILVNVTVVPISKHVIVVSSFFISNQKVFTSNYHQMPTFQLHCCSLFHDTYIAHAHMYGTKWIVKLSQYSQTVQFLTVRITLKRLFQHSNSSPRS